ncbi:MAG TPA: hypothetical protein VHX88_02400 [Solirubrobacteraceae bacterium]|jgi:uncharacterized membrane protein|nr:hypothetical protein [Solirubrobacteraceae bacterium]
MIGPLGLGSQWRRAAMRTNLWLVPAVAVVGSVALFAIDRHVYDTHAGLSATFVGGDASAASTILTALAAAIITVACVSSRS